LRRLKALEKTLGRKKRRRMGPREIDLDLLLYGSRRFKSRSLALPHPRMFQRKFVLKPLADLAPGLRDPLSGKTMARLLRELTDPSQSIRLYRNVRRKTRA
jgi:2-amino-4-hydroxy-6-hydroxymethyldihydropteridine diphosphokinase